MLNEDRALTSPRRQTNLLVTALGSYGDVYPMVGIAKYLQTRGHRVTLFTHTHFSNMAHAHELNFVAVDTLEDYERFANHPDLFDPRKAFSVYMQTVILPNLGKMYNLLEDYIQPEHTAIIAPMTVLAARLIQEKYDLPMITIHTMPMQIKSAHEIPRVAGLSLPDWSPVWINRLYWWVADKMVIDPLICPDLNRFRRELGLGPVNRIISKWVHSPDLVICLFPEWFSAPQPDWPPNTVTTGFPLFDEGDEQELTRDVREFLANGPPPIVFMPGSLMQQAKHFFEVSKAACESGGYRAIFLTRYKDQIPNELPASIKYFPYVPFSRLLPHSALLVHHGGIGTTAQALRAGIPQLIHPMAYDQFDNASRLDSLGVGKSIKPDDYTVNNVIKTLKSLINSSIVQEKCGDIAQRLRTRNALDRTCELIEKLVC